MAIISPEPDEGFSRLMAIGGGLFREGFMLAATTISIELIAEAETQRLDGTLHCNVQHRELLKQAVKDVVSLSIERIRQGETNIKSPMFLSMVLAQAAAIEEGTSCEFKIAQGARDSLEFCHDLLQTLIGTGPMPTPNEMDPTSISPDDWQEGYGFDLDLDFFFPDAIFS